MEQQLISAVEEDGEQSGVSELCRDVKECIFAKLPLQSICLSRLVCKEWKSLLSSHSFLSSLPPKNPWLLLCGQEFQGSWHCVAYCFSTQKWLNISLSFLPNMIYYNLSRPGLGLLLFGRTPKLCVCNPLMRIYAEIEIDAYSCCNYIVRGGNGEPYLVVALEHRRGDFSFQIYHYFQDSWKLKSQFSGETGSHILNEEMVECNSVLFWRAARPMTIVGYNIDGFIKPVTIAPLPTKLLEYSGVEFLCMVPYGSSLLVVAIFGSFHRFGLSDSIALLKKGIRPYNLGAVGIVIWEFFQDDQNKLLWKWKEFARMSPEFLPEYIGGTGWYWNCACVGDHLCFSHVCDPKVFAYNLKEGFWQCLPQCTSQQKHSWMMCSFDPKLILNQFFKSF